MKNHYLRVIAAVTVAIGLASTPGRAQSVAPAPDRPEKFAQARASAQGDEVLQLSPFVVVTDKDTGYVAADTVSASRLSTNLLMTPGDIQVMTRDLINDLGVFNIDEASGWLTNSRPLELGAIESNGMNPGSLAQDDSGVNVSLRGFSTSPSTRNYFNSAVTPKEYNVERVESSRGPNAILYGEGGPGGQVNYITKRAKNRNFGSVRLRTDSLWSKGISLDINRKITDKLAFRYNGNLLDQRYYISRTRFENTGNAVSLVYQPFSRTTVSADIDYTRTSRPGVIMSYGEQYAKWDKQPVTTKLSSAAATARGLVNWGTGTTHVWVEGQGFQNLGGWSHTAGYGLPIPMEAEYPQYFGNGIASLDRSFNANPKDVTVKDHATDVQLTVDHQFLNKLSVQVAGDYYKYTTRGGNYYFTTIYQDPMPYLTNAAGTDIDVTKPNPNYGKLLAYSYVGRSIRANRDGKAVRAVVAYPLEFKGTTTISAFAQHYENNSETGYYDLHLVDPAQSILSANTSIYVYRYLDNLTDTLPDFRKMYATRDVPATYGRTKGKVDAFEVAASGSYLHDRLSVIGGFRRDKSQLTTWNGDAASRDTVTGEYASYTVDPRTAFNNTVTVGLVYFPIRYVGLYANHAEGFQIQTIATPKLDGTFAHANIVPAKDRSFGLRFNLVRGNSVKVVGSLGYYEVEQTNSAFNIGVGNINTIWNNHGLQSKFIQTFSQDPLSTSSSTNAISGTRSYEGRGWEGELTANVGKALRLTVNVAFPRTKQSNVGGDYTAYVNANLPQWEQWVAQESVDPNGALYKSDKQVVDQLHQTLSGFQEGRSQNYTYKYRYNLFGVYTLQQTAAKGLRIGLGTQMFGPFLIGNEIDRPFAYVYRKAYYTMSGSVGYGFKLWKRTIDLQLNVDNLLNYDKPLYNGLFVQAVPGSASVNIPYGFKYAWPRIARLTMTMKF